MNPFVLYASLTLQTFEAFCRLYGPFHPAFDGWALVWRRERERLKP